MTSGRYGLVLREVGRLLGGGSVASLGAGQLLERFADSRDEAAFEALVSRHGPMVLGTCRRMLSDPHDVDDAFQATFLVLARKAGSIRDADRLGPWLHGVARRVATRSRALSARRRSRERPGVEDQAIEPPDALEGFEHRAAIDEELARLPEKYRAPLVLCYLEGLTHDEAAEHLRWPVGTVRSRLAGGRDRLRDRLTRRGLAPNAAVPAILTHVSIPQALLSATVRVATSAGSAPAHVANLAKGALAAMMWNKLKVIAALGLMAGLTSGGAAALSLRGGDGEAIAKTEAAPKQEDELAKLQGTWRLKTRQPGLIGDQDVSWTIEGKVLLAGEPGKAAEVSDMILGEQGGVKTVDLLQWKEDGTRSIQRCLYRVEGNTLVVCGGALDGTRPTDFKPGDSGLYPALYRFDRQPDEGREAIAKNSDDRGRLEKQLEATKKKIESLTALLRAIEVPVKRQGNLERPEGSPARRSIVIEERNLIKQELEASNKKAEESTARLQRLEPSNVPTPTVQELAEKLVGRAGSLERDLEAAHDQIKQLESRLADQQATIQLLQDRLEKRGKAAEVPSAPPADRPKLEEKTQGVSPMGPGSTGGGTGSRLPADEAKKTANPSRRPASPMVMQLGGALLLVIPAEHDRATVLNTETGTRTTYRPPQGVTRLIPLVSSGLVSLDLRGPELRQVVVFDAKTGKWYPHDLAEPATEANPIVGPQYVTYSLGRFLYMFSVPATKWSVLELKRDPGKARNLFPFPGTSTSPDGKMMIPEGDLIHIYSPQTGEWTHIDIKDEK